MQILKGIFPQHDDKFLSTMASTNETVDDAIEEILNTVPDSSKQDNCFTTKTTKIGVSTT